MKNWPAFNLKGTINPKKKRINTGGCTRALLKANPAGVKKNRDGPKSIVSKYEANIRKTTMTKTHEIKRDWLLSTLWSLITLFPSYLIILLM
jgi:hypothetical protein